MPYLKFTRDHRGYENTFLVDTTRRRGRELGRVLYWFRTPPQVKVGRAAIDEDAIRALEEAYPNVDFDWTRILEARPPEPEPAREERRRPRARGRERDVRRDAKAEGEPVRRPPVAPLPTGTASGPDLQRRDDAEDGALETGFAVEGETTVLDESPDDAVAVSEGSSPTLEVTLAEEGELETVLEPGADEDGADTEQVPPPGHALEPSAAERVLGSEGLLRLRARHAEVCARIAAQVADVQRQDTLRTLAERLNPDGWVTEAEVRQGLEGFEQVLDEIRREVGPLRRRTRRGGRRNRRRRETHAVAGAAGSDGTTAPTEPGSTGPRAEPDEPDGSSPDER